MVCPGADDVACHDGPTITPVSDNIIQERREERSIPLSVLGVAHCVLDDALEPDLECTALLFVYTAVEAFHAASAAERTDGGSCYI
jgi:hypothetical protein